MSSQSWLIFAAVVVLFAAIIQMPPLVAVVDSSSIGTKILRLPGQPQQVSFQQHSGYLTVDEKQQRALFYYLVEAESNPASKPLVLWLEGGPGCSSVGTGAFSEHGPFRPSGGGKLVRNDYSWNKEANMLYLESPAGVGFSYSANKSFYELVNDTITAQDNLVFLQLWFDKFPEYKNRDFYITGQSYAGHYVPQLAHLIVESGSKFNLKGIAVENPLLEFNTDFNSRSQFYWSHGLISDSTYHLLISTCNTSQIWRERITGSNSTACSIVRRQLAREIPEELDTFDVTADVCISKAGSKLDVSNDQHPFTPGFQSTKETANHAKASENIDVCIQEKTLDYLNRKDVQEALHAQLVGGSQWTFCSEVMTYDLRNVEIPTINIVGSLVSSGIRVLVYSGDQDPVIPFIGSRILVNRLANELGLNATVPYRVWLEDKQVGGWTQVYDDNLVYAVIRGAGHFASFSSPKRALRLFKAFLDGKPLPAQ